MVRPKTTALFFDKLWVHPALIKGFRDDELEPHRVPPKVCVTNPMGAADYYDSWKRQSAVVASGWLEVARTDATEAFRRLSLETWDLHSIFDIEAMQHFEEGQPLLWEQLRKRLPPLPSGFGDDEWRIYLSTQRRNKAIAFITHMYAAKGIRLTPVYLTPSEYDEVAAPESRGLEICLDHVPTVADSELSWEKVFELRKDRRAVQKLNRLRRWFTTDLAEKSKEQISATLGQRLDDYVDALRKHEIRTVLGGFTAILSFVAGPTAASLLTASPLAALVGGLAVASGTVAWVGERLIERSDLERNVVAYIYDVRKLEA
jgi:hypothetical protein